MTDEQDKILCKTFPQIFCDRFAPMTETAMCWGFECGGGWFSLIYKLCEELQKISDETGHQVVASQVKEKFGGLRFYLKTGATDEQHNLISEAEHESYETCEYCGSTVDVGQTEGWITTLCKECATKHNYLESWHERKDNTSGD